MSAAIGIELQFFLTSIVWGIILLVIYDVLRIFRRVIKHKWIFVAVEDILFWVVSAILIFQMMYEQNNGIIRGFSILGMTLGMIIYNQSLSGYAVKWISKFFLLIGNGIKKTIQWIAKPIQWIIQRVKKVILFFKKISTGIGKKLFLGLKKKEKTSKINE